MDSLTHVVLGACIGEVFLGKKIGRKAMVWGAIAQSIPDIDFVASFWMSTTENLLAHRGFTHSLLFAFIVVPLLALLADRWHRPHNIKMRTWLWFFGLEVCLHILLDGFNTYGTGWLEPFSHYRFSMNTIFVADPLFTIFPATACLLLIVFKRKNTKRVLWAVVGIGGSFFYLGFCVVNKLHIEKDVRNILDKQSIPYTQYMTTPTPFNNLLWYVVAGNDSGYYVGFRSVFDKQHTMSFSYFPKNTAILAEVSDHESLQHLVRFSKGFYTVERVNGTVVFNDLRFGQVAGWKYPKAGFSFYYYLQHPDDNDLLVQRGRFKGWNREVWISLFERIRGD